MAVEQRLVMAHEEGLGMWWKEVVEEVGTMIWISEGVQGAALQRPV